MSMKVCLAIVGEAASMPRDLIVLTSKAAVFRSQAQLDGFPRSSGGCKEDPR